MLVPLQPDGVGQVNFQPDDARNGAGAADFSADRTALYGAMSYYKMPAHNPGPPRRNDQRRTLLGAGDV
ncbi:hypothetical protein KCP69_17195 [Salmonella enterica subsp. enterica]|nr:hypothetical protein KCP69_17195 [Salmonella enterica subsp. enterica]